MFDEGGEEPALSRLARRENFGVPLHAQNEGVTRTLDSFDHAIVRERIDDQATTETLHGLMMAGIHSDVLPLENLEKL